MSKMRASSFPEKLETNGVTYIFLQARINGGAVYVSDDKSSYLRIGEAVETAAEHIHLVSLRNKGYPVGEVLGAGKLGDHYYYVEQSLGEATFGQIFGREYGTSGVISTATFDQYITIIGRYLDASFQSDEQKDAAIDVRAISFSANTTLQYGLDSARVDRLMTKAQQRLEALPCVEIHADLGPFNIMPQGVIDFEMAQIGPVGYDVLAGAMTGYYFPKVAGYKSRLLYEFSDAQYATILSLVDQKAFDHKIHKITDYFNDFLFLRTFWSAARPVGHELVAYEDPGQERFWSEFRARILSDVIKKYEADERIDPRNFPVIGVS